MENLMNKVINDLKNFAPIAPEGMEERIQTAMSKKKSFWVFSWYTMNVYAVALLGAGALTLVFSNGPMSKNVAQTSTPVTTEANVFSAAAANVNTNSHVILNAEMESKSSQVKTTRERKIVQVENSATALVVENCQTTSIAEPAAVELAETVEVQRISEETQVPCLKNEVVKVKGRTLRLTRLTGK